MKRLIIFLAAIFTLTFPVSVLAATPNAIIDCSGAADSTFCQDRDVSGNPLFGQDGILTKAAQIIAIVTGIISMFIMTIAGLRFVMSGGDSGKIESARGAIIYSAIGLAVALSAQAIVSLVLNNL
jgi:hypothetical protein